MSHGSSWEPVALDSVLTVDPERPNLNSDSMFSRTRHPWHAGRVASTRDDGGESNASSLFEPAEWRGAMIVHVSTLRLRSGTTAEEFEAIAMAFEEMQARIPSIRSIQCGADIGVTPNSGDFAVIFTFDDREGVQAYRNHPAHADLAREFISPFVESYTPVQFEV